MQPWTVSTVSGVEHAMPADGKAGWRALPDKRCAQAGDLTRQRAIRQPAFPESGQLREYVPASPLQVRAFSVGLVEIVPKNPPGHVPQFPLDGNTARCRA